jgi:hypothetical protein
MTKNQFSDKAKTPLRKKKKLERTENTLQGGGIEVDKTEKKIYFSISHILKHRGA